MLKHGILGLLNYGDMTGYEIMTVFRESLSHFWTAQTSQIYRELQAMEKQGWVASTHVKQEDKPDKNIFSITETGIAELKRWVGEGHQNTKVRIPLLMQTFFRGELGIEENIAFFQAISDSLSVFRRGSEEAMSLSHQYAKHIDNPEKALYWGFTIEFGQMYEEMVKQWCARCIEKLEALQDEHLAD